jgi:hypothetical protein
VVKVRLPLAALSAGVCVSLQVLSAPLPPSYSADFSATGPAFEGKVATVSGTIWVANGTIRRETLDEGHLMVYLITPADRTVLQLVPDQGYYADASKIDVLRATLGGPNDFLPYDPKEPCSQLGQVTCLDLGTQTVGGRRCANWQFTYSDGKIMTGCIDVRIGFMVQTRQDNRTFELTNIQEGPQPPSLFSVPAELSRVVLDPARVPRFQDPARPIGDSSAK